ncbi:NAD-dependent epimerase/dehydratase family protein [Achromobacter sp. Marseille-Q4962]|uniref:NAD-dependent epimerase/dehydratase family protein n=1 Tax=Achromobacter sp. Marseille-Q4962 TaxID=2942202 RepID=UPI002073AFDD|nr:NAD-dependent epimerase/dehydratase family protein [Achromobacter sp. Marseille-Q4962]
MSERILLAGCGDLGLRVARLLRARGNEVHALRRHPPDGGSDGIRWLRGDLADPASLRGLPAGIGCLVYLPAPGSRDPDAYRSVFVDGLRNVLQALAGDPLRRVVFISSSAVYGEHHGAWVDENTPAAPLAGNGRILLEAEALLASQPVPAVALRLAGLYGPGRMRLVERLRAGKAGAPRRPPHWANRIHIDDAAAAVAHLVGLPDPAPVYIGCDSTPLPLHELYAELARLAGAPAPAEAPAPAHVGSKKLSNARLLASGFSLQWPDSRQGYAALLAAERAGR